MVLPIIVVINIIDAYYSISKFSSLTTVKSTVSHFLIIIKKYAESNLHTKYQKERERAYKIMLENPRESQQLKNKLSTKKFNDVELRRLKYNQHSRGRNKQRNLL